MNLKSAVLAVAACVQLTGCNPLLNQQVESGKADQIQNLRQEPNLSICRNWLSHNEENTRDILNQLEKSYIAIRLSGSYTNIDGSSSDIDYGQREYTGSLGEDDFDTIARFIVESKSSFSFRFSNSGEIQEISITDDGIKEIKDENPLLRAGMEYAPIKANFKYKFKMLNNN